MYNHVVTIPNATAEQIAEYEATPNCSITVVDGTLRAEFQDSRPLDELKAALLAKIPELRWTKEQEFIYNGMRMPCDETSIGKVTAAVVSMQLPGAPVSRRWKFGPDDFRELDFNAIVALGMAMATHVQGCFAVEEQLVASINQATTVEELSAIDLQSGWPL